MKAKISLDYVKSYMYEKGYVLISDSYEKAKAYLEVECPNNHRFLITWDAFKDNKNQKGRRCAICSKRKIFLEDVRKYAEAIGYEVMSMEYQNSKQKLSFECPNGHLFQMSWNNFKHNRRRCPECQNLKRWNLEEVENYFSKRGYHLLSNVYKNINQKLKFICPNGHEGEISFNKFKNTNHGCEICGGSKRLEIRDIKAEFESEGLNLLSTSYENAGSKLRFECTCGCIDEVSYRKFKWASREGRTPKRKCRNCMIPEWHNTLNEDERIKNRKFPEYYKWVKNVKLRDSYICQCCGFKGENVIAHHLDGYSWCKEKRTELSNGVTLCHSCHTDFHSIYGFANSNKNQYIDFKKSRSEYSIHNDNKQNNDDK